MIDTGIIKRTIGITRRRLGLTKAEMQDDIAKITASVADPNDRDQMRAALDAYEREQVALGVRPMSGKVFKAARLELGLTGDQLAPLIGLKPGGSVRSHVSSMENERKAIQPHMVRLLRAYLSGYRPPDWPTE